MSFLKEKGKLFIEDVETVSGGIGNENLRYCEKEEIEIGDYKDLIKIMQDGRQVDLYLKEKKSDEDGYLTWDVEHWSSIEPKRFIRCYSLEGRVLGESTGHNIYDLEMNLSRKKPGR